MWCKKCKIELDEEKFKDQICPICGEETIDEVPSKIFWCETCNIPVIVPVNKTKKYLCPICNTKTRYLAEDIMPVFPEERLFLELVLKYQPNELAKESVWKTERTYYVNGKPTGVTSRIFEDIEEAEVDTIREQLKKYKENNTYEFFDQYIQKFIKANELRLSHLTEKAMDFIQKESKGYPSENITIAFSGGKDSTIVADLVIKALKNQNLICYFNDTTLEYPFTMEYIERFRKRNPFLNFYITKNEDQNFIEVCKDIGPPAMKMRWCCNMFKTGPVNRILNKICDGKHYISFQGMRSAESASRSKYKMVDKNSPSRKIQLQDTALPIFYWKDIDDWLYLLSNKNDFNEGYRQGYNRIGCWCCPNGEKKGELLSKILIPEKTEKWLNFLIDFAKEIGKPDPEEYIKSGGWKRRMGGNGVPSAEDVKIKSTGCTTEEHAKIYELNKPYSDELVNLFLPFGKISSDLGQKLLNESIIIDPKTNMPYISIQPFNKDGHENAIKVKTINVKGYRRLQQNIAHQIRKYNACRKCLKCENVCEKQAISIDKNGYHIDSQKCCHCRKCSSNDYIRDGCVMNHFLIQKKEE